MHRKAGLGTTMLLLIALSFTSIPAKAASVIHSGRILWTYTSTPGNYSFRVQLSPGVNGCIGGFLFVDASNPSYQVYVATLMSAFLTNRDVDIVTDANSSGFCEIKEILVRSS